MKILDKKGLEGREDYRCERSGRTQKEDNGEDVRQIVGCKSCQEMKETAGFRQDRLQWQSTSFKKKR